MEPFDLPEFYMPFAARLNPHLEAAREHGKAWARELGMLDPGGLGVWDEDSFNADDIALFAALCHPDASDPALNLLTDWYVWRFFLDDVLVAAFKRGRPLRLLDCADVKLLLERLLAFMPVEGAVPPSVVPTNRPERGLADLWSRTAPTMSADWRRRFSANLRKNLRGNLWELINLSQRRLPDLIDYVEMRRMSCGAELSADLSLLAVSLEIAPELLRGRPVRGLINTFGDWAGLSNDIFSYRKEIEVEGEINNGVLVVQRFLGCELPHAVGVVNDLLTARLRQFERIAETELLAVLDESAVDKNTSEKLRRFVAGLRDWLAGDLLWQLRTGRYQERGLDRFASAGRPLSCSSGLGTSAARVAGFRGIVVPAQKSGRRGPTRV